MARLYPEPVTDPTAPSTLSTSPDFRPRISVVICTHNRADALAAAIDSVLGQALPIDLFEVLVIDNRSRDHTKAVIEQFGNRVRSIYEPTLGLSYARNRGWRASRGQYIAFLDDDARAEPQWLGCMLNAFEQGTPTPDCVGGRVMPLWEAPRPPWLSDRLLLSLSVADWTATPHAVTDLTQEWLVGSNIAFSRAALERLNGFSTALGRVGSRLLSGEEIMLQRSLLAEGSTCWYEPRAQVNHSVPASRLTHRWFYQRQFAQGLSDATIWRMEHQLSGQSAWERASKEFKPLFGACLALPGYFTKSKRDYRFEHLCGMLWRIGFLRGLT